MNMRKTKIICTLGPAVDHAETIERLIRTGMNAAHELDVGTGDTRAEHQTADPAKAINANFNAHNESLLRSNLFLK